MVGYTLGETTALIVTPSVEEGTAFALQFEETVQSEVVPTHVVPPAIALFDTNNMMKMSLIKLKYVCLDSVFVSIIFYFPISPSLISRGMGIIILFKHRHPTLQKELRVGSVI